MLRLLARSGSGAGSVCNGRSWRRTPCITAGTQDRSGEKDGSIGGRTLVAFRTFTSYLTYHRVTEQPVAPREFYVEPGSAGYVARRGECYLLIGVILSESVIYIDGALSGF